MSHIHLTESFHVSLIATQASSSANQVLPTQKLDQSCHHAFYNYILGILCYPLLTIMRRNRNISQFSQLSAPVCHITPEGVIIDGPRMRYMAALLTFCLIFCDATHNATVFPPNRCRVSGYCYLHVVSAPAVTCTNCVLPPPRLTDFDHCCHM